MYTQCKHCKAIFRVGMKDLTTAQGLLRCGECDNIFDAMETLSTTLPDSPFSELTRNIDKLKPKKAQTQANTAFMPSAAGTMQAVGAGTAQIPATMASNTTASSALTSEPLPLQKKGKKAGRKIEDLQARKRPFQTKDGVTLNFSLNLRKLIAVAGVIALLLLLVGQIWYKQRDWFVEQTWAEGLTRAYCAVIGCTFNTDRKVFVELVSLDVYSHPDQDNMLYIGVTMANHMEKDQAYPKLEIRFLDDVGEVVAKHLIPPEEYLSYVDKPEPMLAWNVPVSFNFALPDPGERAASFVSDLRY